ncbi:MAG: HepT-like ribonuclease domain-containing protein [Methanospirillum sp.]
MLEATEKALSVTSGMDRDRFLEDENAVLIISRLLEIIGEAAKRVPERIRLQNPDVPWKDITGTRDILIHAYFHVDAGQLWRTVTEDLSPLRDALRRILSEEGAD